MLCLLPQLIQHFENPNPFCKDVAERIAQVWFMVPCSGRAIWILRKAQCWTEITRPRAGNEFHKTWKEQLILLVICISAWLKHTVFYGFLLEETGKEFVKIIHNIITHYYERHFCSLPKKVINLISRQPEFRAKSLTYLPIHQAVLSLIDFLLLKGLFGREEPQIFQPCTCHDSL